MFDLTTDSANLLSVLVVVLTLTAVIVVFAEGAGEVISGLFRGR